MKPYTLLPNVAEVTTEIAPDSIVSRTIYSGAGLKVIWFGFAPGQELSEHTSMHEVVIHVLAGSGVIGLDGDEIAAEPGVLVRMDPRLPHSVVAATELRLLLYMLN
jgi:quercetin dioxygenase-like cupin family protein